MYYHLTYYRDWHRSDLPLRDMEICIGTYSGPRTPTAEAAKMNAVCAPNERFRVYESPGKKLSKKSKKIFDGTECDVRFVRLPQPHLHGYPLTGGRARRVCKEVETGLRELWPLRQDPSIGRRIRSGVAFLRKMRRDV